MAATNPYLKTYHIQGQHPNQGSNQDQIAASLPDRRRAEANTTPDEPLLAYHMARVVFSR